MVEHEMNKLIGAGMVVMVTKVKTEWSMLSGECVFCSLPR